MIARRRKSLPSVAALLALVASLPSASFATTIGPNVNASVQAGAQSSADIAIDPIDPKHVIGSSNDISTSFMRLYESYDGGATWTNTTLPLPASPYDAYTNYPAVTFDATGNAYASYLGVNSAGDATTLVCVRKNRGDTTWGTLVTLPAIVPDKNLMTADRTGGAFNNRVYVAWANNTGTGLTIQLGTSTDGGASFSSVRVNDTGQALFGAAPAVGPGGEVYVAWINFASTAHNILIDRSLDGGATFGTDHLVRHWVMPTGSAILFTIPADPHRGISVLPYLDVDRSNGPNRGTIYCVYNDLLAANGLDILLLKSTDGGATWSAPKRVNDDATGVVRDQFLPRVAVDDYDGSIHVAWYDTRDDVNNKKTNLYYSRSTDGGATFEPNQKVTTTQSDETLGGRDANGYGDYIGLASSFGIARPLWTDSRSGTEEIYSAEILYSALAVPPRGQASGVELVAPAIVHGGTPVEIRYRVTDGTPPKLELFSPTGSRTRRLSAQGGVARWDLRDEAGRPVASGVYFLKLAAGEHTLVRKLVVLE